MAKPALSPEEARFQLRTESPGQGEPRMDGTRPGETRVLFANVGGFLYNRAEILEAASRSTPEPAAQVGNSSYRSDAAIEKSKKPQTEIAKQQVVSQAGDTVPIVFCKRSGGIGGTWVQPPLVKTGSIDFVGQFLYAITQGQMVSSPVKHNAWVGSNNIKFLTNSASITLTHYYSSAASMEATPNACPITSGKIFCDLNSYSYLQPVWGTSGYIEREADYSQFYNVVSVITRGTGDTSNSVIDFPNSGLGVYDNKTGNDVTAGYWSYLGVNPATTTTTINPLLDVNNNIIGGRTVGTILRFPTSGWTAPDPNYFTNFGATGPVTYVYGNGTVENQVNPANPASTGTLTGVQYEIQLSPYANPAAPPSTADYTTFADITFLQIAGNIYDPPDSGSYPTTTRQISLFYENGTTVDLYSGGLVGGVYATGASNQFVDLAMYLFTLMKRASGASTNVLAAPIDVSNLQTLATFCTNTGLFFNGIIEQSVNTIDYISKTAPYFLLSFVSSNGRYSLQPLLPLNASNGIKVTALTPVLTFTEDDILPGTFQKEYIDADQRRAVNISLVWREADPLTIGIQRTTTVRYSGTDANAPTQQYDMTDFCTSAAHATTYGKYELARRKYSVHTISFSTALLTTSLIPTQIIKVQRQRINSRGDNRTEIEWYQVNNVKHSSVGITSISASQFPVNGSDIARISNEVVNGTFEVI